MTVWSSVHAPRAASELCRSFVRAACRTWRSIRRGDLHGLIPSEETITDVNLLDLRVRNPRSVEVYRMSKWQEGTKTGADWEWWIGGGHSWVGMRIQAKLLRPGRLSQLPKLMGYRRGQQLQRLLESAQRDGLFPIYCFYNAEQWFPWPSCHLCDPMPATFGCAIVPAPHPWAEWLGDHSLHWRSAALQLPALPWSCLVCPGCWLAPDAGTPAEQVYWTLVPAFERFEFFIGPLRGELPSYILALREGRRPQARPDVARILVTETAG